MIRHNYIIFLLSFLLHLTTFGQCIDNEKITYGGDWGYVDFIHLCPTYSFAFEGDTSKNWNLLSDPIDIKQAPIEVLLFKQKLEKEIIKYSGADFFSKLKFNSVEVVYSDKLNFFKDSGRENVSLEYCKAKYFFYYEFKVDNLATYHIGIALDKKGDIISKFKFPSKANYTPIDEKFEYCKLIDIGRKVQPKIDPIENIKLDFDKETNRFYWLLTQKIVNSKEGRNYFNQVQIDASDLNITKKITGHVNIVY